MIRRLVRLAGVLVAIGVFGAPDALAQTDSPLVTARYRSDFRFRTISTGNVDIYFHQPEADLARRLARIVGEVAPVIDRRLGAPRGRVRIILVDQTDVSNGWATIVPYNLIELAAVPPPGTSEIGNTDDWLRLVFTHEYTHVVHLERSRGWLGALRHVFGRMPAFYPNLFLPSWQIEGLATFEESAITQQGRVAAGDFRMLLEHAKAAGRFAPLDRASTAVIDWPGGTSAYLYGAFFHQFLAERWGEASLRTLSDETAARLPFFGSLAFKEVYGRSLGSLWKEFERSVDPAPLALDTAGLRRTRLTRHGFTVTSPFFGAGGRLFYSVANPHGFPSLMELAESGPRALATRYYGRQLSGAGGLLVFDQLEVAGHVGLLSDLYAYDLRTGDTRRLTHNARAADPDLSSDGRTLVCTIQETGRRILATLVSSPDGLFGSPVPLVSVDATEFSSPRWSPDGRFIAAERRQLGGPSDLVIVEAATGRVRSVFSPPHGRVVTPAWTPDGSRLLFGWDADGEPFLLHAIDTDGTNLRRLMDAGDGAHAPAPSGDGRLVFVAYTADGYDLFSIDASAATWADVPLPPASGVGRQPAASASAPALEDRPYSPADTLAPTFFTPYVERDGDDTVIGAATVGFDALGRHTYVISAGWGVARNHLDLQAEYTYARWRPALFYGLSGETNSRRDGFIRSRDVAAGALLPFRQARWSSDVLASISYSSDDLLDAADRVEATRERYAARAGLRFSNARAFGYSISAEEGAALSVVSEFARGSDGDGHARSVVAEARGYVDVLPRHGVLAARAAFAASRGSDRVRREFSAAGSGPQGGAFDVGFDAIGLLRGFDDADLVGRSAVSLNLDYRVPLGWPQRGIGTLPVFLRAVHAAAFADVGHAWDDTFRVDDLRRSVGAELSFDIVLGGAVPTTIAAGIAARQDPSGARGGAAGYVRIGRAF